MTSSDGKKWILYLLKCRNNGKKYYGVTQDLLERIRGHVKASSKCLALKWAIQKYGKDAFELEIVSTFDDIESAYASEIDHILRDRTQIDGYNIRSGGPRGSAGVKIQTRLCGRRFGNLQVIADSGLRDRHTKAVLWTCRCGCGKEVRRISARLRGGTKFPLSCGCGYVRKGPIKHGKSGSREYSAWAVACSRYEVCHQWVDNFPQFLEDVGPCPRGHILTRRNRKLPHSRENSYWASRKQVMGSSKIKRDLTAFGETKSMMEWSKDERIKRIGISYGLIRARKNALKWDDFKTLSTPLQKNQFQPRKSPQNE